MYLGPDNFTNDSRCSQDWSTLIVSLKQAILTVICSIPVEGRHDDPEERMKDRIRKEINDSHRFNSFADQRSDNFVKWHVTHITPVTELTASLRHIDGHDYMWAVSEMLDSAKDVIFILVRPYYCDRNVGSHLAVCRIGGLLQSCTSVAHPLIILNGGWTEC